MFKKLFTSVVLVSLAMFAVGCSTTAQFKLPPNSKLEVYERPVEVKDGVVKTRPFFWTATTGTPYVLRDEAGNVLRQGKLKTRFRVMSIFWPPFALLYWPMGFGSPSYDLTREGEGYLVKDTVNNLNKAPAVTPAPEAVAPTPKKKKK